MSRALAVEEPGSDGPGGHEDRSDLLTRVAVVGAVLVCLALGAITARDTRDRVGRPHPGFAVQKDGLVGPSVAVPTRLAVSTAALQPQDLIIAVDGRPIASGAGVWAAVDAVAPGTPLRWTVRRRDRTFDAVIETGVFRRADYLALTLPNLLGAGLLLGLGATALLLRPRDPLARRFALFALGASGAFGFTALDNFFAYRFVPWTLVFIALAKASFLHIALTFPSTLWPLRRHPVAGPAVLYGAMALHSIAYAILSEAEPGSGAPLARISGLTFGAGVVLLVGNLIAGVRRHPDARVRQQARIILPGPLIGCLGGAVLFATTRGFVDFHLPMAVYMLPVWASCVAVTYAILRSNLFEFDALMRRGIAVASILLGASVAYIGFFALVQQLSGAGPAWLSAVAAVLLLVVLVPTFEPLRRRLEERVQGLLQPGQGAALRTLHETGIALVGMRDAADLAATLRRALSESFRPAHVHVVVGAYDEPLAEPDRPKGLTLAPGSALGVALRRELAVNADDTSGSAGGARRSARRELAQRELRLAVPFPPSRDASGAPGGGAALAGGLLLGARGDGRAWTSEDAEHLEVLAAQAALAFQNARAFDAVRSLQQRLSRQNVELREELAQREGFDEIVGRSSGLEAALAQVEQVASTDTSVLVLGETGSGKELVVRALHRLGPRSGRPLVKVACGAVPETLLESEFFGHERGAFTGATSRHVGRLEVADGGTLFLDDVDALPLAVQAKLLRAVQEGEIQRLGSTRVLKVDVRVVSATNRDLLEAVEAGTFRQDLYYRLAVVPIRVPALRERREDVPALVQHFIETESRRLGREPRPVAREFLDALCAHDWPGNIRELRNTVQRAVVMSRGDAIDGSIDAGVGRSAGGAARLRLEGRSLAEILREHKIERIRGALREAGGNQRRAAERLGLHRQSLARMLRDLGIAPEPQSPGAPGATS